MPLVVDYHVIGLQISKYYIFGVQLLECQNDLSDVEFSPRFSKSLLLF